MKTILKISFLVFMTIHFLSCSTNSNNTIMNISKVQDILLKSNDFFITNKKEWINDSNKREDGYWTSKLTSKMDSNGLFSKNYISNFEKINAKAKDQYFGYYFFQTKELGDLLKSFCNADSTMLKKEITKISDTSYRYTTKFYNVLNDVPIPDQVEGFDWLWDKGENGEIWQFSILIIKENDKWVIDEIDKYMAVPIETED